MRFVVSIGSGKRGSSSGRAPSQQLFEGLFVYDRPVCMLKVVELHSLFVENSRPWIPRKRSHRENSEGVPPHVSLWCASVPDRNEYGNNNRGPNAQ